VASRRTHQLAQYSIDQDGDPVPLSTTHITLEDGTPSAPAWLAFDGVGNLWVTDGIRDELLRFVTADLIDNGTMAAARTIEGFGTFGPTGGVLIAFDPPPEDLPLAR
jgi:hypothetical protein